MAITHMVAFAAGFASGWVGRSAVGSSREAVVRALVVAHKVKNGVRRIVAEQREWVEDLLAEGRARYEQLSEVSPIDTEAPPQVVGIERRGRAA